MTINRARLSATSTAAVAAPTASPAPAIAPAPAPATSANPQRSRKESNGYLDPDQTLPNFAIRELGMSFEQLLRDDPHLLLRKWLKRYRASRNTAIGGAGVGAGAVLTGVLVGAFPLILTGGAAIGGCALLIRHHGSGVRSCETETRILDEIRPVLELLAALERRGADRSELVTLYDRLIKRYSIENPLFNAIGSSSDELKQFFEQELQKHQTLSRFLEMPTTFTTAATQPPAPVQQPALQPATPSVSPVTPAPLPVSVGTQDVWGNTPDLILEAIAPILKPQFIWADNPTAVPIKQRAQEVIAYLDGAGFPVGVVLHTPTTLGYGGSQSGKSTILHLASILDLAMGKRVLYINPDDDVPPIKFSKVVGGCGSAKALAHVQNITQKIDGASKGELEGYSIFFDEWSKMGAFERANTPGDKSPTMQGLVDQCIQKVDKTGLKLRGAAQVKTLKSLGIEGLSDAMGRDFLVLHAIKEPATSWEKERASGFYSCDRGNGLERWETPESLKVVVRPDGLPDPVMSMLLWFPELRDEARVEKWMNPRSQSAPQAQPELIPVSPATPATSAAAVAAIDDEEAVEQELTPMNGESVPEEEVNKAIAAVLTYLKGKEGKLFNDIYKASSVRAALNGANRPATEAALSRLVAQSLVIEQGGSYSRNEAILSA